MKNWKRYGILLFWAGTAAGVPVIAERMEELEAFEVLEWRVANPEPAGTYGSVVSGLRHEPLVEVQARNLPEAQADLTVRGSIFEAVGFRVGAATLLDPQTGHYSPELPVSPGFLGSPDVLIGVDHALSGFNHTVATVQLDWRPLESAGEVVGMVGDKGSVGARALWGVHPGGHSGWGVEVESAVSRGDGSGIGGRHHFRRLGGRVQYRDDTTQSDFFVGWQSKYFEWPFLYAVRSLHELIGSSGIESEDLRTELLVWNHRRQSPEVDWQLTTFFRRHRDDYELDVEQPGLFNPYEHETRFFGVAWEAGWDMMGARWKHSAQLSRDRLESTALVFGPFTSRSYFKGGLVPEWTWSGRAGEEWTFRAGGVLDWTNRDDAAVSGLAAWSWTVQEGGVRRIIRLSYAGTTQVPGYTAVGSNPGGGLFRGNPNLSRERADVVELSGQWGAKEWEIVANLFHRWDRDLVDWVFDSEAPSFASRFAEPLDLRNRGVELQAVRRFEQLESRLAYGYLSKSADYARFGGDASFYALNYPRHRVTWGAVWRPLAEWAVRGDAEWRWQEPNVLRDGRERATFVNLAVAWSPQWMPGMEWTLAVDNLGKTRFQEVPGVPGVGRQVSLTGCHRW